jgi:hypothetical protein
VSRGVRGVQPGWMGRPGEPGRFTGVILNGCLVAWSCEHGHETRDEAQQCSNEEARRRGIRLDVSTGNGNHR